MTEHSRESPGFLGGHWLQGRSGGSIRLASMLIWLLFIVFPLINAIGKRGPALRHGLVIAGAAAFVAAYVALVLIWRQRRSDVTPWLPIGILVAVASALTFAEGSSWGFLFIDCAACMALVSPSPAGVRRSVAVRGARRRRFVDRGASRPARCPRSRGSRGRRSARSGRRSAATRQPTLDGEPTGARMALSGAGIEADVEHAEGSLDPETEAVLAWAVREGATNVLATGGATRCRRRSWRHRAST